jgi:hypothetical protein
LPSVSYGQGLALPIPDRNSKEWRRITTGQDSATDVGVSTLILEPNGLIRATFRISLSKSEDAPEKPGSKYKVRLLTIQFDSRKSVYRIIETTLQDSSDKEVYASGPNSAATWRPLVRSSQTYNTYYSAALNLQPLGVWKVSATSDPQATGSADGPASIVLALDRFQVGRNTCSMPSYESVLMTREEVAKLTLISTNGFELSDEKVKVVKIKCDLASETNILVLKSIDRAILLSGGNLFALER